MKFKNFVKSIVLVSAMTLMGSSAVFASSVVVTSDVTVTNEQQVNEDDIVVEESTLSEEDSSVQPKAPATPVTAIGIRNPYVGTDGHVHVIVDVTGYGTSEVANLNGITQNKFVITPITPPYSNIASGWSYNYDLGVLPVGSYKFTFQTTSSVSPWNTMSASVSFNMV